jgi:hypothetical protein
MSAGALLSRLEKVKQTGPARWIARCPAHDDRRASLSVRETDDGRVLVHDFAGCSVENILGAVGLEFDALFPERKSSTMYAKPERQRVSSADALRAVAFEAVVVMIAAGDVAKGKQLSEDSRTRMLLAVERIQAALQEAGVHE